MSEESKGGAPKKLSTKDILAAARAQAAGGTAPAPSEAAPAAPAAAAPGPVSPGPVSSGPVSSGPVSSGDSKPAAPQAGAAKAAGAKPKSTADILAAARAQAGGASAGAAPAAASGAGAEKPAPAAKPAAKPAAPGGKPKSTADILAAARAGAGGGAAKAAAPAGAGEKPAPKAKPKAAAAVAEGNGGGESSGLSVQEMLAAVRPAAAAPGADVVAKPAKPVGPPPMPVRPTAPAAKKGKAPSAERRGLVAALLLSPFALAWTLLTATTGIASLAMARFMMPNVLTEPPRRFKIGPPSDYDLGTVATKLVAQYGVWIVHTDQYHGKNLIYALASVCTHLGCTPSWLEGEQKFKCPCHGSGFYITGINFEGPAPRPLERVGIRLAEDGMLEVDKSLKFQEEMGQWADPSSFYEVVG